MADGVDNGVEAGGQLGEEAGQLRDEWGDTGLWANSGHEDNEGVGAPDAGPQQHVSHSDLGDLELSTLRIVFLPDFFTRLWNVHVFSIFYTFPRCAA